MLEVRDLVALRGLEYWSRGGAVNIGLEGVQ